MSRPYLCMALINYSERIDQKSLVVQITETICSQPQYCFIAFVFYRLIVLFSIVILVNTIQYTLTVGPPLRTHYIIIANSLYQCLVTRNMCLSVSQCFLDDSLICPVHPLNIPRFNLLKWRSRAYIYIGSTVSTHSIPGTSTGLERCLRTLFVEQARGENAARNVTWDATGFSLSSAVLWCSRGKSLLYLTGERKKRVRERERERTQ